MDRIGISSPNPFRDRPQSPLKRFLESPSVGRDCPSADALRLAFTQQASRTQRRSDGTISLDGIRFEIPSRFRHFKSRSSPLCVLGSWLRSSHRSALRDRAGALVSAGSDTQRRWLAAEFGTDCAAFSGGVCRGPSRTRRAASAATSPAVLRHRLAACLSTPNKKT